MRIVYFADDASMGDTSHEDCNRFRKIAFYELRKKYPDHEIEVVDAPSYLTCWTDDDENRESIEDYCSRLWENANRINVI